MQPRDRQKQLNERKEAMRTSNHKQIDQRCLTVWLFLTGQYNQKEAAKIIGVSPNTLATHVVAYLHGGLEALNLNYRVAFAPHSILGKGAGCCHCDQPPVESGL